MVHPQGEKNVAVSGLSGTPRYGSSRAPRQGPSGAPRQGPSGAQAGECPNQMKNQVYL